MGRAFILAYICASAFGQDFEAASVKPSAPGAPRAGTNGGPGTRDPERFTSLGMPLWLDLCIAFDPVDCQQQIVGPGWIRSEGYDIAANVPPGVTKEQFQKMLQNLLIEHFKLVLHHETRTLAIFELVVAKNGPKLKESPAVADAGPNLMSLPKSSGTGMAFRSCRLGVGIWLGLIPGQCLSRAGPATADHGSTGESAK